MLSTTDVIAHELQTDHRAGRMLEGLIEHGSKTGKVKLTTDLIGADGETRFHQTFDVKGWDGHKGRMLTVEVAGSGDWALGIKPIKVMHIDLAGLHVIEIQDERNSDKLLRYAAEQALTYAWLGADALPKATNGTISVLEAILCGICGRTLTDPVSIARGIGPDCAAKATGTHTILSRKAVA